MLPPHKIDESKPQHIKQRGDERRLSGQTQLLLCKCRPGVDLVFSPHAITLATLCTIANS